MCCHYRCLDYRGTQSILTRQDFSNNSNGTFFLQVYYLFAGGIILISMLVAGIPVLRVIRTGKDINSFRFTSLLVVRWLCLTRSY